MKSTKQKALKMIWQVILAILPSTGIIWSSLKTISKGTFTMSIDIQFITNVVLGGLLVWLYRQISATAEKQQILDENLYMLNAVTTFRMVKRVEFVGDSVKSDIGDFLPYLEYMKEEKRLIKEFLLTKLGEETKIKDVNNLLKRWYHELD